MKNVYQLRDASFCVTLIPGQRFLNQRASRSAWASAASGVGGSASRSWRKYAEIHYDFSQLRSQENGKTNMRDNLERIPRVDARNRAVYCKVALEDVLRGYDALVDRRRPVLIFWMLRRRVCQRGVRCPSIFMSLLRVDAMSVESNRSRGLLCSS